MTKKSVKEKAKSIRPAADLRTIVAENIKKYRIRQYGDKGQAKAAKEFDISVAQWNKWESGSILPGLDYQAKLASFFGILMETLRGEEIWDSCTELEFEDQKRSTGLVIQFWRKKRFPRRSPEEVAEIFSREFIAVSSDKWKSWECGHLIPSDEEMANICILLEIDEDRFYEDVPREVYEKTSYVREIPSPSPVESSPDSGVEDVSLTLAVSERDKRIDDLNQEIARLNQELGKRDQRIADLETRLKSRSRGKRNASDNAE